MKIKGWKEVFRFTFTQQVKTKSFIVSTIVIALIMALMAFLADFLPVIFLEDELSKAERAVAGEDVFTIETLYINNESGHDFDFTAALSGTNVTVNFISASEADAKIAAIADTTEKAMVSKIILDESGFSVDSRYAGGESGVQKLDGEVLNSKLADSIRIQYLASLGVPEDQIALAMSPVYSSISSAGEEPMSMIKQIVNTVVPMISAIVLFIFIFSYSQLVAQAVAIEKSSRIIEYLLTSIKPLAIILGKVLAMCCVSLMQFVLIGFGGTLGFLVSIPFGIVGKVGTMVQAAAPMMTEAAGAAAASGAGAGMDAAVVIGEIGDAFSNVDAGLFIIMIVTFILGFLFYAGIAGLAGASVSKMEDLSSAIQPLSLIGVLGFYLAYFPQISGEQNTMSVVARYMPISSPFILSSDYMLGNIGIAEALVSIAVLAAADIAVMMLVAKVYESVILHTGNRLKLGDMLKMSK